MSLEYKVLGQAPSPSILVEPGSVFLSISRSSPPAQAGASYSTDGISWSQAVSIPQAFWMSATYGEGKFVAVSGDQGSGSSSLAIYSTDALTWTAATLPERNWQSITYGNGKFVAVATYSDTAAYSTDGITWTIATLPSPGSWQSITHGDGKFVAVTKSVSLAAYSTDGITWTASTMPSFIGGRAVTYGDGKFVATGYSTEAAFSTDGLTWTASTMPSYGGWLSITYGEGKFVAVARYSTVAAYSTNGIAWTAATIPAGSGSSVTYADGSFVAVGIHSGSPASARSTDGITWTATTSTISGRLVTFGDIDIVYLIANEQYSVPLNKQAIISSIYVSNSSLSTQRYSIAVVPNGETLSDIHYLRRNVDISASDFHTIETKITLFEGDKIITEGISEDVSVNIFGVER